MKLSVILVIYNMQRAAPRSIEALLPSYQQKLDASDYEVIVVENGSSEPLEATELARWGDRIQYHYLEDAPPSPAYAINFAVERARGDVLAIMVDGAHILTPGTLSLGLQMFTSLSNPIVVTLPFFLGPGPQFETVLEGYDEQREDELLSGINWPEDGYRLFEIGVPYRIEPGGVRPRLLWMVRQFESNCLFARRDSFFAVGGCEQRFDIPGGGILIPDLYRRLADMDDAELVQLMGEASFHQLHGGTTTNVSRREQKEKWESYLRQYHQVRGKPFEVNKKPLRFYGHISHPKVRELLLEG